MGTADLIYAGKAVLSSSGNNKCLLLELSEDQINPLTRIYKLQVVLQRDQFISGAFKF
jgi:hypothetical protein